MGYVRSLASVHPSDTGRYPAYHGYGKIHCSPFAVWTLDGLRNDGDISLHIYKSEFNGDIESLQRHICQFEKYLQKWIDFEDTIVVVAHGTFNSYLVLAALGFPFKENFNFSHLNTGVTLVQYLEEDGVMKTKLKFLNDTSHLV